MVYICSKQGKIDRLWGVFIRHILQMVEAGIKVEYVRRGEVILNGIRYEPVYFDNTMRYEPIGKNGGRHIVLTGHDIGPMIEYLRTVKGGARMDTFVVCMDSVWVRDAEMFDVTGVPDDELSCIDSNDVGNGNRWHDMEPTPFIAVVKAESEEEACRMAAEQKRYDERCLFAVKV